MLKKLPKPLNNPIHTKPCHLVLAFETELASEEINIASGASQTYSSNLM